MSDLVVGAKGKDVDKGTGLSFMFGIQLKHRADQEPYHVP